MANFYHLRMEWWEPITLLFKRHPLSRSCHCLRSCATITQGSCAVSTLVGVQSEGADPKISTFYGKRSSYTHCGRISLRSWRCMRLWLTSTWGAITRTPCGRLSSRKWPTDMSLLKWKRVSTNNGKHNERLVKERRKKEQFMKCDVYSIISIIVCTLLHQGRDS